MSEQQMSTGLYPHLSISDAAGAIDFYKKAFGAVEQRRSLAPDGRRVMHASLEIYGHVLMLADDFPEFCGGQSRTPQSLGGSPVVLHLQVTDADAVFAKAVEAGAEVVMPLAEQFWGDRYGQIRDPFGFTWAIGQRVRTVSPEEMKRNMETMFGSK